MLHLHLYFLAKLNDDLKTTENFYGHVAKKVILESLKKV